jgi:ABC transport system ATP-binding/permease protein
MATAPLLFLRDIGLTFGGEPLIDGADLSVSAGERLCLVGRNGSGKSTLLKIAAGLVPMDRGERFVQPGATIRYLPQEPDLSGFATTLSYVEAGLTEGDQAYHALYLLEELGLSGQEHPSQLSGGEARRAAIARALAPEPDILLIDEPTNHLDLPAIEWLERELASLKSALVLISHDRYFLETLSRSTLWLDRGKTRLLNRGFAEFEAWRDDILNQEEVERHKLDRQIVREEHWVRYGVTARRKRNQGRMAALQDLRVKRDAQRRSNTQLNITASEAETSGKLVIEARKISKSYGARPIVTDFSMRILRGDRIGIVGANGAGKTTLLHLLTGELAPDQGVVRLGANLEMASLDQQRASLDPTKTLSDTLTEGRGDTVLVNGQPRHVIGYMKDFLFKPEQARTPVGVLSGGERGRLTLARALSYPSNLLVLDEPTNDLDLETLDLLQEMLTDYPGTVIVVSHDRGFLDRVATSVLIAEGNGCWREYAGGYSDMVRQRGLGVTARSIEKASLAASKQLEDAATSKQRSAAKTEALSSAARPKKLSFKDKHALDTLPARIDALQGDIKIFQEKLSQPQLFTQNRSQFDALSAQLAGAEQALTKAEEQWLMLELLREEIEGT